LASLFRRVFRSQPEAPVNEHRIGHSPYLHAPAPRDGAQAAVALFGWSGAGIVLFGERDGDRWVVARAWRQGDALTDVRRWSFAAPVLFVRQVRRLVFEATDDAAAARTAGAAAQRWTDALA
jgi:hypothetical protein